MILAGYRLVELLTRLTQNFDRRRNQLLIFRVSRALNVGLRPDGEAAISVGLQFSACPLRTTRSIERSNFGWLGNSSLLPALLLLLPEVPRYHRVRIGLDAAKLLPAIDDDEVEVYGLPPAKINGYGTGAVRVHGIGGTHVNQRYDQPVKTLGSFSVASPFSVTDDARDRGVRPGRSYPSRRDSAGKGGAEVALDAFERTVVRAGIGLFLKKYIPDPEQDEKTEHEAGFGWDAIVKHRWILLVSLLPNFGIASSSRSIIQKFAT
jgi:hypothetical protein